jgi:type IV pilus assembly protein PilC
LHLPFCGELYRSAALARTTSTLALLIDQGVPLVQALYLAAASAGNRVLERALHLAAGWVLSGASLSDALKESEVLPPMLTWRVGAAADSGTVVSALRSMADLYLRRVDLIARVFAAVLEPLLIILLGGCLFLIVLGVFMPLITIISGLSGGGS